METPDTMGFFTGNKDASPETANEVTDAPAEVQDIPAEEGSTEDITSPVGETSTDTQATALQEMTGKLLRLQADFDNFRRRNNQARAEAREDTRKDILANLLPVYDNFLRALDHSDQSQDYQALRTGIDGIRQQMDSFFKSQGLESVPAVAGHQFDPAIHEATGMVPGGEPNTIAQELVRGFQLNGNVVRPAQVLVFASPDE